MMLVERIAGLVYFHTRVIVAFLCALAALAAHAEFQNDQVGFSPHHVLESSDEGENIDALTGNLTLTIPLGPRFTLNDTLSYGVTLYYNAKQWEFDCDPNRLDPQHTPCHAEFPTHDYYGLGFSLLPGRIYRHYRDYPWIYRVRLEDGSEHIFCDADDPASLNKSGCGGDYRYYTFDAAHLQVRRYHDNGTIGGNTFDDGWIVSLNDGRELVFGNVVTPSTKESLVTEVRTTAKRADGAPFVSVAYLYHDAYRLSTIVDSQGRETDFSYVDGSSTRTVSISVPAFAGSESKTSGATAVYTLHLTQDVIDSPSDHGSAQSGWMLNTIDLPVDTGETYQFSYRNGNDPEFGWLLSRTVPTGARFDYGYRVYNTSECQPYHTELISKTLTMSPGQPPYRWSWERFASVDLAYNSQASPSDFRRFSGSNPWSVFARDAFDNLTVYNFFYTPYDEMNEDHIGNCYKGECGNTWNDGLLANMSQYAGPLPDTDRLVKKVSYTWDSDTVGSVHSLVNYHQFYTEHFDLQDSPPAGANSMPLRTRQISQRVYTPGNASHTVESVSSDFSDNFRAKHRDDYLDGSLSRPTPRSSRRWKIVRIP